MNEFIDSLCITSAVFRAGNVDNSFIGFTTKALIDNQERVMAFSFTLKRNSNGEMVPDNMVAHKENPLSEVSEEEYQFQVNLKKYQNELFERLKEENSIRLHALFL